MRRMLLLGVMALAACAEQTPAGERCAPGTVATNDGCYPIPSFADAGRPAAADARASLDGGLPSLDAEPADGGAAEEAGVADLGPMDQVELSGTWALELRASERITNTALNTTQTVLITHLARVELQTPASGGAMNVRTCLVEPAPFGDYTTIYPAAAILAFGTAAGSASYEPKVGGRFESPQRTVNVGWAPERSPDEEVPVEAQDPRLRDADGDGNPGVTLLVQGPVEGEVYVAQRYQYALTGSILDGDHLAGSLSTQRVHNVVQASNALLAAGSVSIEQDPDTTRSGFRMVRTVAGSAGCAAIIANRHTLFPGP